MNISSGFKYGFGVVDGPPLLRTRKRWNLRLGTAWVLSIVGGLVVGLGTARGAEWSCGFEIADGFAPEASPAGAVVGLIGGTATVIAGDAAQGEQLLRFVPVDEGDALILLLDPQTAAATERTVSFAIRFPDGAPNARLVLTQGQTVELRPVDGQLEVAVPGGERVRVGTDSHGWTSVALAESIERGSWDLLVDGAVAVSAIPLGDASTSLSDLLIFVDGSVELDAVAVSATGGGLLPSDRVSGGTLSTPDSGQGEAGAPAGKQLSDEERNELFGAAYLAAIEGRIADAEQAMAQRMRFSAGDGRGALAVAQQLTILAHALRDGGRVRPAKAIAFEALRHLQHSREMPFASGDAHGRATVDFVAGQIWEEIMVEPERAERAYRDAATIDPQHTMARGAADRMARLRAHASPEGVHGKDGGEQ